MTRTELGKIDRFDIGIGGYQDAMMGVSITLKGNTGWMVDDFKGTWGTSMKVTEYTRWTEEDRSKHFDDTMRFINKILTEAKKSRTQQLIGVPVEVTFNGNLLQSWRILTEVL